MHQQQFCPICNNSLMNTTNYCFSCGYALESKNVNYPTEALVTAEAPEKFSRRALSALGILLKIAPIMLLSTGAGDCDETGCCILDCCGNQCDYACGRKHNPNPYSRYTNRY